MVRMGLISSKMVIERHWNRQKMAVGGASFEGVRGPHCSSSPAKTPGSCSFVTRLPQQLVHVILRHSGGSETMREGTTRETRRKKKKEKGRERETRGLICVGERKKIDSLLARRENKERRG